MPTVRDQQRLEQVARAVALPEPQTKDELGDQLCQIEDAIRAGQSTDDLGSAEANDAAWQDVLALTQRYARLKRQREAMG